MKRSRSSDSSSDSSGTESSDLDVASASRAIPHNRRRRRPSNHRRRRGSGSSGNIGVTYQSPTAVTKKHLTALLQCMVCRLESENLRSQPSLIAPVTFPCGHTSCSKHSAEPDTNTPASSSSSNAAGGPASKRQSQSRFCPISTCAKLVEDHKKGKATFSAAQALHAHSSVRYYLPPAFSSNRPWSITSGDDLMRDVKVNKILTLVALDEPDPGSEPEGGDDNNPGANADAAGSLQEAAMGKHREGPLGGRSATTSSTFVKCLKEILSCEVCLMLYYEPMTLVCGHTFCARCLQRTLDQNSSCPLCRHQVGPEIRARLHLLDLRDRDVPTNKVLLGIILLAFPKEYMDRRQAFQQETASAHAGPCNLPVYLNQMALPGHTMRITFDDGSYRLMLRRIMQTSDPRFGMMLVPRYSIHGETNHGYGTMMQIQSIQLLPDNRSICEVQAVGRFRVLQTRAIDGYIVAKIQTVEDVDLVGSETFSEHSSPSGSDDTPPVAGPSSLPPSSLNPSRCIPPSINLSPPSPPQQTPSTLPQSSEASSFLVSSSPSSPQASSTTVPIPISPPSSPPPLPRPPSPPLSEDLSIMLSVCTRFVDQLRNDAAPWVVRRLNNSYGDEPPKEDLVAWCWWLASVSYLLDVSRITEYRSWTLLLSLQLLPIDDHEKAKLLPIRSPELRLRLICHWIQKLNDQWWYSKCVLAHLHANIPLQH